ncbi:hypothetical protein KJ841_03180, partial [Patescibacteria group bacterium]|nr:hypothetical protein [Patescibacteria group bacterium]
AAALTTPRASTSVAAGLGLTRTGLTMLMPAMVLLRPFGSRNLVFGLWIKAISQKRNRFFFKI